MRKLGVNLGGFVGPMFHGRDAFRLGGAFEKDLPVLEFSSDNAPFLEGVHVLDHFVGDEAEAGTDIVERAGSPSQH